MQLLEKRRGEEDRPTINYTGSVAKKGEKGEEKRKEERKKREFFFTREEKKKRILVTTYISTRSSRDDVWTKGGIGRTENRKGG